MNKLKEQMLVAITENIEPIIKGCYIEGYEGEGKAAKSCTEIAIDFAKGFSEWLQLNGWFTYDQFKKVWYYTFEQGTSMSEANYLKNYTKTTDQLITLYIESIK